MTSRSEFRPRGPRRATRTPSPVQSGPFNPPPQGQDWEIAINGDLTDKQHELIAALVEVPRRSRGTVWFDSGGGSVYVGLALCSIIRLRGLRVTGVVAGECSSAAILPFAACERRFVTSHSTLLFHPMRWQSAEDVRLEEATEWARHFKNLEGDLDKLLSKLFDFPEETIREWSNPGRFISGQEIVEAGLAKLVDIFAGDLWSQIGR
ncbi:MAG: ATP-dependent Clp protease proteolytic subunit [Planctomycetaceae bacterium]|jgi:ATP-dependent Clp protease protease subunit|nr:ATP-dependent Clp protease proteolytic subunit [Planctomycetaceae bacterium]